eukprot:TRINITY_DN75400_c0_g1_i1.p1 TRINITY_DN75400_c0_g1~~TRINITY_DN75400_c0_g1_i1.p1  ORF type:complete len:598 (-),score=90.05 TRINITY_DN75400_c0_g1_i1:247-2040(-)
MAQLTVKSSAKRLAVADWDGGDGHGGRAISCARWLEVPAAPGSPAAESAALVLSSGHRFRCLPVLGGSAVSSFSLLHRNGEAIDRVIDFWFVYDSHKELSLFALLEQPGKTRLARRCSVAVARWADPSGEDEAPTSSQSPGHAVEQLPPVLCGAAKDGVPGEFCAAGLDVVFVLDAQGTMVASRHMLRDFVACCIAATPTGWAIAGSRENAAAAASSAVWLLRSVALDSVTVVDAGAYCIHNMFSLGRLTQDLSATTFQSQQPVLCLLAAPVGSTVKAGELAMLTARPDHSSREYSVSTCRLPVTEYLRDTGARSVCSSAFLEGGADGCMLCIGFSEGTLLILRSSNTDPSCDGFQVCGRHDLSVASGLPSAVVACGFSAVHSLARGHETALFAGIAAGAHRIWITGSTPTVSAENEVDSSANPPAGRAETAQDGDESEELEARCVPEPVQLSGEDHLDALIHQTMDEIAALELERTSMHLRKDGYPKPGQPAVEVASTPMVSLAVPEAPELPRVPRDRRLDPKWAAAQKELLDPTELARAYLDSGILQRWKAPGAAWPPAGCVDPGKAMTHLQEDTLMGLEHDYLEAHVMSLCQSW